MKPWTFLEFEYWYDEANMQIQRARDSFDCSVKTGPYYDGQDSLLDTENAAVAYKLYRDRMTLNEAK